MVRHCLLLLMLFVLVAADQQEASLQAGYRAWLQSDLPKALQQYEQALRHSRDPGYLACELGCLHAQAGNYRDAAEWFRRSLEDATGLRRVKAAYGHATALTHAAHGYTGKRAVAMLKQAMQSFELAKREALAHPEARAYFDDAEHNLAIARTLMAQKQNEPEPPEDMVEEQPTPSLPQPLNNNEGNGNSRRGAPLTGNNTPGEGQGGGDSNAGRGNLPPLPDDEKVPPISATEAQRRLQELLQRLRRPLINPPSRPGSKDW